MSNSLPEDKNAAGAGEVVADRSTPVLAAAPSAPASGKVAEGWHYGKPTKDEKDCRRLVSLEQGGMQWIGIRAWHHERQCWMNGGEPETATVVAWQWLPEPAWLQDSAAAPEASGKVAEGWKWVPTTWPTPEMIAAAVEAQERWQRIGGVPGFWDAAVPSMILAALAAAPEAPQSESAARKRSPQPLPPCDHPKEYRQRGPQNDWCGKCGFSPL